MAKFHPFLRKTLTWVVGIFIAIILIITALSYLIQSSALRHYAERQMNRHLKGYTVQVGRAYFHPFTFTLDLRDLILTQNAHPDPPVAAIKALVATVHWRALIRLHVVGDFTIDRPKIYVNLEHVHKEEQSKVPLKQKGWQDALESVYPLKINVFRINDGELTYQDKGPTKPIHVSQVNFVASNIRNIESPDRSYPSPVHLHGKIFEKGKLTLDGHANFLQEPHLGFKGDAEVADMELGYFKPIAERQNISMEKGTLSAKGNVEYAPQITIAHLKSLDIKGVDLNYLHLPQTAAKEQERVQKATQTAKQLSNEPTSRIRVDVLKVKESSFGYVNKTSNPNYRVFVDHMDGSLKNFTNQLEEGPATLEMTGKFMGSGDAKVTGTFRPETKNPDFNLTIAIENTDMTTMGDLFQSYGNFNIERGSFSFFSEMTVKGGQIEGYVKPLFKDLKVTDQRTEKQKSVFHKLYIGVVNSAAKLLENRPREEVATKADISGPVGSPKTNTWQIIMHLLQNAFIKSILPGFEKEVNHPEKK